SCGWGVTVLEPRERSRIAELPQCLFALFIRTFVNVLIEFPIGNFQDGHREPMLNHTCGSVDNRIFWVIFEAFWNARGIRARRDYDHGHATWRNEPRWPLAFSGGLF